MKQFAAAQRTFQDTERAVWEPVIGCSPALERIESTSPPSGLWLPAAALAVIVAVAGTAMVVNVARPARRPSSTSAPAADTNPSQPRRSPATTRRPAASTPKVPTSTPRRAGAQPDREAKTAPVDTPAAAPTETKAPPNAPADARSGEPPLAYRLGAGVTLPRVLVEIQAEVPTALRATFNGEPVWAEVTVGPDGTVQYARILRSAPGLEEAAVAAARKWKFTPGQRADTPVSVITTVEIWFRR